MVLIYYFILIYKQQQIYYSPIAERMRSKTSEFFQLKC